VKQAIHAFRACLATGACILGGCAGSLQTASSHLDGQPCLPQHRIIPFTASYQIAGAFSSERFRGSLDVLYQNSREFTIALFSPFGGNVGTISVSGEHRTLQTADDVIPIGPSSRIDSLFTFITIPFTFHDVIRSLTGNVPDSFCSGIDFVVVELLIQSTKQEITIENRWGTLTISPKKNKGIIEHIEFSSTSPDAPFSLTMKKFKTRIPRYLEYIVSDNDYFILKCETFSWNQSRGS